MLFNGGLIPTYLVMQKLNLINTRWAMILPTAIAVWNVIITRTYFQTSIPNELLEASKIDGCNDIKFLLKIVIPLSGPIIAVITLFYAVYHWNSFFSALMYLRDYKLYPLQMVLRDILIQNEVDTLAGAVGSIDMEQQAKLEGISELLKYSLIIVACLPLLIAYPFVQKYFVKGVMIGAIKG
jgi:ABC-type glycerol-3-phosphate transport system permease component